jgi:F-type H+-transporting ATPase subunit delta
MIEGTLSRRYSKALFQLARDAGQEEKIGQEVEQFYAGYSGSMLQQVLTNPAFNVDTRKKILTQVARSQELSPLTVRFLSLLLDRDRLAHLAGIATYYRQLLNEAKGRVDAKVVASSALESAMFDQIRRQLAIISRKEVVLQQVTDPSLLGGLLIELEGKVYDGSIRTQLENMKQRVARGY